MSTSMDQMDMGGHSIVKKKKSKRPKEPKESKEHKQHKEHKDKKKHKKRSKSRKKERQRKSIKDPTKKSSCLDEGTGCGGCGRPGDGKCTIF